MDTNFSKPAKYSSRKLAHFQKRLHTPSFNNIREWNSDYEAKIQEALLIKKLKPSGTYNYKLTVVFLFASSVLIRGWFCFFLAFYVNNRSTVLASLRTSGEQLVILNIPLHIHLRM